uniref:Essential MCU regulator, mitochondrial n=3 Tax=Timema TaxID=61471 RepID=A0A7R9I347_9NEOP|nr:unnamed protein product [Timema bartmani]
MLTVRSDSCELSVSTKEAMGLLYLPRCLEVSLLVPLIISFLTPSMKPVKYEHFRAATTTSTGAVLPEPRKTPFGFIGLFFAVIPGLMIGAFISQRIANFLEENDLFVPSDDDDDDD